MPRSSTCGDQWFRNCMAHSMRSRQMRRRAVSRSSRSSILLPGCYLSCMVRKAASYGSSPWHTTCDWALRGELPGMQVHGVRKQLWSLITFSRNTSPLRSVTKINLIWTLLLEPRMGGTSLEEGCVRGEREIQGCAEDFQRVCFRPWQRKNIDQTWFTTFQVSPTRLQTCC